MGELHIDIIKRRLLDEFDVEVYLGPLQVSWGNSLTDKETGQTIISGMGELHIDIIKRRLLDEFDVEVYLGPLQVSWGNR